MSEHAQAVSQKHMGIHDFLLLLHYDHDTESELKEVIMFGRRTFKGWAVVTRSNYISAKVTRL